MASANSSCAANSGITCVVQVTNIYEKNIDTANNTSVIHIDYQCVCTSDNYHTFSGSTRSNAGNMHVAVDGVWQSYTTVPINHGMSGGDVIASDSREITVSHNDDGSKTSSYYISMDSGTDERGAGYYWQTSSVGYDSITLTKITRDWTVSYDGAGGSTPSSQNKHYGTNITLGNSSRTGYTFQYWHGSDENNYSAGQTFTGNYALTLTAVWSINTWQVSFNANGGTNAPGNQTKTYGQTLTITTSVPTRTLYEFVSWSGSDGGTYSPGSSFTGNYALSLTANWKLAYVAPTITSLAAYHCTSDGTAADDGTYIKVTIGWKVDTSIYSDNQGSGITVTIDSTNVGTISISGTSGTASQVFGGSYNGDVTSNVSVYLYDTKQPSMGVSNSVLAQGAKFLMDFMPNGHVCFGGAAVNDYHMCIKENGVITWHPLNNNLYVIDRGIGSEGYTTVNVPVIDVNRRTLFVYGNGNFDPYYGVIMFSSQNVKVNVNVLNNDRSVSATMIGDHTLKITTWAWDLITIVANFEIS